MAFGGSGFYVGAGSAASGLSSSCQSDANQVYCAARGGAGKLPPLQSGMAALCSHTLQTGSADMAAGPANTALTPVPASVGAATGSCSREIQAVAVAQVQVQDAVAALLQEQPHLMFPPRRVNEQGTMTGASLLVAQPDSATIAESEVTEMRFPMVPTSAAATRHDGINKIKAFEASQPSFYYPAPVKAHPLPLVPYQAMPLVLRYYSGDSWPLSLATAPKTSVECKVPPPTPPPMEGFGEVDLTSATRLTKGKKIGRMASTCERCCCCCC